jgi:hypothetical protein
MPVSQVTIDARAVAGRMSVWPNISGHMQLLSKMATEDAAALRLLHQELEAAGAGAGLISGMATAVAVTSNVILQGGNLQTEPAVAANAPSVVAAADYLDALPAPPVMVGLIGQANMQANPLVMLQPAYAPLMAAVVDGVTVRIEGGGWASIADRSFTVTVANRPLAQFQLMGADTSAEIVGGASGATVWLEP